MITASRLPPSCQCIRTAAARLLHGLRAKSVFIREKHCHQVERAAW